MTDLDIATLRAVVEKATPGPWTLVGSSLTDWDEGQFTMEWMANGHYPNQKNDAAYLAVFNPELVGALLDRLEAAEGKAASSSEGESVEASPGPSSLEIAMEWAREYLVEFHPAEPASVSFFGKAVVVRFKNAGPVMPQSLNGHQVTTERWLGDDF